MLKEIKWQMLVMLDTGEIKKSSTSGVKMIDIDYRDWYCPINDHSISARHNGYMSSGVCDNFIYGDMEDPWWNNFEKIKTMLNTDSPVCKMRNASCFCGTDVNSVKAVDKETYNNFVIAFNNIEDASSIKEASVLDKSNIVALGVPAFLKQLVFHLDYGLKCNFDCCYCSPDIHDNYSPFLTLDKIEKIFEVLDLKNKHQYDRCELIITGGEPTLSKELHDVIDLGSKHGFNRIKINTNGTATRKFYSSLIEQGIYFYITFHEEFTTDSVIKKVYELYKLNPKQVKVSMLGDGDLSKEYYQRIKKVFNNDYNSIELNPIYHRKTNEIVNSVEKIKIYNELYGRM